MSTRSSGKLPEKVLSQVCLDYISAFTRHRLDWYILHTWLHSSLIFNLELDSLAGGLKVILMLHFRKKEGCFDPKKQRTIHLLEADFSEGCKIIFSRRMMHNARINNQIPEEQYARKGGKSNDEALHNVLTLDNMRLLRRPGVGFSSDLMN